MLEFEEEKTPEELKNEQYEQFRKEMEEDERQARYSPFKDMANRFYIAWEKALRKEKYHEDYYYGKWCYEDQIQPFGLLDYFNINRGECSLENSELLITKLVNFSSIDALENTDGDERELYGLIVLKCTNIVTYKLWEFYKKEFWPNWDNLDFTYKYRIAKRYFPLNREEAKSFRHRKEIILDSEIEEHCEIARMLNEGFDDDIDEFNPRYEQ